MHRGSSGSRHVSQQGPREISTADPVRVWQISLAPALRVSQDRQGSFSLLGSLAMQPEVQLSRDEYIRQMRREIEEALGRVADAVNEAPPGQVIAASEEKVRDLFAGLRQKAYETAVQMRVDAAEAAFPPSGGPADRQGQAE